MTATVASRTHRCETAVCHTFSEWYSQCIPDELLLSSEPALQQQQQQRPSGGSGTDDDAAAAAAGGAAPSTPDVGSSGPSSQPLQQSSHQEQLSAAVAMTTAAAAAAAAAASPAAPQQQRQSAASLLSGGNAAPIMSSAAASPPERQGPASTAPNASGFHSHASSPSGTMQHRVAHPPPATFIPPLRNHSNGTHTQALSPPPGKRHGPLPVAAPPPAAAAWVPLVAPPPVRCMPCQSFLLLFPAVFWPDVFWGISLFVGRPSSSPKATPQWCCCC